MASSDDAPAAQQGYVFQKADEWRAHVDAGDEVRLVVDPDEVLRGKGSYTGTVQEIERVGDETRYVVHGYDSFENKYGELEEKEVEYRFRMATERDRHDNVLVKRRSIGYHDVGDWHELGYLVGGAVMLRFFNESGGEQADV